MSLNDREAWAALKAAKAMGPETKPYKLAEITDEAMAELCGHIENNMKQHVAQTSSLTFSGDDRIANLESALFRALCDVNDVALKGLLGEDA